MRYFVHLAYKGTRFSGWQRQPEDLSVQEQIEKAFATILRESVELVGCGRTDAGVHASHYTAHFDFEGVLPSAFIERLNKLVGSDIAIKGIETVGRGLHARFGARKRSYEYHITFLKNPFAQETEWLYPYPKENLNFVAMQQAATLLLAYSAFAPFCKTHSDALTMECQMTRSEWVFSEGKAVYHISANRFLRGMVRLIVGMCLNVGLGKVGLEEVIEALEEQTPLKMSYSVPPNGLYLTEVNYK